MFKYITYNNLKEAFIALIDVAIKMNGNRIAVWNYPEEQCDTKLSEVNEFNGLFFLNGIIEKVTVYDDNKYCHNLLYALDSNTSPAIINNIISMLPLVDSVSVYRNNEKDWFMSIIFHEKVCVLKNLISHEDASILADSGFSISDLPPENW